MRELFLNRDALFWMMFLRRYQQAQSPGVWETVTGTAPLTLEYALPKAIKSLIEPALIIFLAAIVGVIILSVILPMFSMYNSLSS